VQQVTRETPASYADLAVRHAPALLRLAVMLTGNAHDAEDLLQSTFARATRHGDRVAQMAAPAGYLRRVMLNEHTSRGRSILRRVRTAPLTSLRVEPTARSETAGVDQRDEVWAQLSTLPPKQRAVLVLRFYEDLDDATIADVLGCSNATVRSNASRALAALRARLTNLEES
jgi:RNA polymerase sigma-70 factor (sigma-E family)